MIAGAAFAIAWTPCTGPILGAILATAAQKDGVGGGGFLLAAYSLGLAVPFIAAAFATGRFLTASKKFRRWLPVVEKASGAILLVAYGLLFAFLGTVLAVRRDVV